MGRFGTFIAVLAVIATAAAGSYTVFGQPQTTFSQSAGVITGYAWSSNIGWISLNCLTGSTSGGSVCGTSNYSIAIDSEGLMSGYAWSSNIGLITANAAQLTGCPAAPCTARMEGNNMRGWMRALSHGGGWDGFISLSSTSSPPAYGPGLSGTAFSGFAWGDDVVGWVDFQYADTDWSPCTVTYQCPDSTHYDNVCTTSINENVQCGAGLICSPGVIPCITPANANGFLTLSPQLVPTGNTTEITWDVEGTVSCEVTSDQDAGWSLTGADEGTGTSHDITETTLFTLTCTNELGENPTEVDTATAVVVPTWVER